MPKTKPNTEALEDLPAQVPATPIAEDDTAGGSTDDTPVADGAITTPIVIERGLAEEITGPNTKAVTFLAAFPAINEHQHRWAGDVVKGLAQLGVPMNFGEALELLKAGGKVTRLGWNGKGMWLALQVPDAHSKMKRPYIYLSPVDGTLVPWVATHSDLLDNDWVGVL